MSAVHERIGPTDGLTLPAGVIILTPFAGRGIECQIVGNTLSLMHQPVAKSAALAVTFGDAKDHDAAALAVEWLHRNGWKRAVLQGRAVHDHEHGGEG